MDMDYGDGGMLEEVWYLRQNPKFRKEVADIRKRYSIPPDGIQNDVQAWKTNNWSHEETRNFNNDLRRLISKCRGTKSKNSYPFKIAVGRYVMSNDPFNEKAFYLIGQSNLISTDITPENKVAVTLFLDSDTGLMEAKKLLETYWDMVEKDQNTFGGKLIKPSEDFDLKIKIWTHNKLEGLSEKEIENLPEILDKKGYSEYDIRKKIKLMDERITSSFK